METVSGEALKGYALDLNEYGYIVTPSKNKRPILPDYYNLDFNTAIEKDWSNADGINLLCGRASKVIALDIDVIPDKNPDLYKRIMELLPGEIFAGRKGNPKKYPTQFFQYNGEANRKFKYIQVEILSDGGNCCLPPGFNYQSQTYFEYVGRPLTEVENSDLLILDDTFIEKLEQLNEEYRELSKSKTNDKEPTDVTPESGRCNHGSHNKLSALGVALFKDGKSFEDVCRRIDLEDKKINKKADFSYFQCPSRKEFKSLDRVGAITKFVAEIFYRNTRDTIAAGEDEITEYEYYADFFDSILRNPKKCILSGSAVEIMGAEAKPILNRLESIQSYAKETGLKKTDVNIHLHRYIENMEPQLLVDLPKWDGKDWIGEVCKYIKLKDCGPEIFEDFLKFWTSRVFARLESTDNQNLFLLLRGDQGLGKDYLIKKLFKGFRPYFGKFSVQPHREIDTWHQSARHLILHLEEFDQSNKLGIAFLKELITTDFKEYRLPYDRAAESHDMYASFISTANVDNIFRDSTGNRRFAVFDIEAIDRKYPQDFGLQVLSQGRELWERGYELRPESVDFMARKIESLTPDDMEASILEVWNERVNNLIGRLNRYEFSFNDVEPIIKDLSHTTGWKPRTILSYLKRKNASRKSGGKVIYFSTHRDMPNS